MAASELAPFAKTGGLGDVLASLPPALGRLGHEIRCFLPAYGCVNRNGFALEPCNLAIPLGPSRSPARFWTKQLPGAVTLTLVEGEEHFAREDIYGAYGGEFEDNVRRFVFFSRAVCEFSRRSEAPPDVIHAHDWQGALIPFFLKYLGQWNRKPARVLTLHNLGYQGRFGRDALLWLSLEPEVTQEVMRPEILEDHGRVNFLKAGIVCADKITTVSTTYAREILSGVQGRGLEEFLRRRGQDFSGILNGVDYALWDPRRDTALADDERFDASDLSGKTNAGQSLRRAFNLSLSQRPILGVVSRLAAQKGIDLVIAAGEELLSAGCDLVVLGQGDERFAAALEVFRAAHPDRVGLYIGYREDLSHKIMAGCDMLLFPSRYEPCGLTQLYALRYGTLPVAHRTGGLADTIVDAAENPSDATGFLFDSVDGPEPLVAAVKRALLLRKENPLEWISMQRRAMTHEFSWSEAARRYEELYRSLHVAT